MVALGIIQLKQAVEQDIVRLLAQPVVDVPPCGDRPSVEIGGTEPGESNRVRQLLNRPCGWAGGGAPAQRGGYLLEDGRPGALHLRRRIAPLSLLQHRPRVGRMLRPPISCGGRIGGGIGSPGDVALPGNGIGRSGGFGLSSDDSGQASGCTGCGDRWRVLRLLRGVGLGVDCVRGRWRVGEVGGGRIMGVGLADADGLQLVDHRTEILVGLGDILLGDHEFVGGLVQLCLGVIAGRGQMFGKYVLVCVERGLVLGIANDGNLGLGGLGVEGVVGCGEVLDAASAAGTRGAVFGLDIHGPGFGRAAGHDDMQAADGVHFGGDGDVDAAAALPVDHEDLAAFAGLGDDFLQFRFGLLTVAEKESRIHRYMFDIEIVEEFRQSAYVAVAVAVCQHRAALELVVADAVGHGQSLRLLMAEFPQLLVGDKVIEMFQL
nr:hypothetical protein [Nocardia mexicana]